MKTLRHDGVVLSNLFEDFPVTENCNTRWQDDERRYTLDNGIFMKNVIRLHLYHVRKEISGNSLCYPGKVVELFMAFVIIKRNSH